MATPSQPPVRLAFGPFEVNPSSGELRKSGIRVRLSGQPFQILLVLLIHPGEVVSREHLRDTIWPEGTFVDFEHGLNAALNKLRRALGDSAEKPRYIETVPGRGYRFIGPVEYPRLASSATGSGITPVPVSLQPQPGASNPFVAPRQGSWAVIALATVTAVAAAFGIWGVVSLFATRASLLPRAVVEFVIPPPPGTIFAPPITRQPFAISPDGKRLAFTATGSNGTLILIRELASLDMRPVPGTEGAWGLFWSPDSRSIFYSVKRNLQETNLESGSTNVVATPPLHALTGAWRSKGDMLLDLGPPDIYELLIENGALRKLPFTDVRWPQFLSHDRFLNIVFDRTFERYRARVTEYGSRKSVPLMDTDSRAEYVPPRQHGEAGYLLYIRGASLLAQPFDADHLRLAGEPFSIAQNVTYFRPTASACFSASDTGVLVFQTGFPLSELNWFDRSGRIVGTVAQPLPYVGNLRISPDGRRIAAGVWSPEDGGMDIWTFEENGRESRRVTFPPAVHNRPVWSPDGKRLVFASGPTGPPVLATMEVGDAGKKQQLLMASDETQQLEPLVEIPTDWSGDGRFVAFDTGLGEEEQEVWLADTARNNVTPLLQGQFAQWGAVFSPDGHQIAFISAESGRPEVYVQAFDSSPSPHLYGERRQVSRNGAWFVRWRPDGRELFYLGIDNWLQASTVVAPLEVGEPKPLFRIAGTPQFGTTSDFQFDVTRDGKRFIMSSTGSAAPPAFTVIENWQEKFHR